MRFDNVSFSKEGAEKFKALSKSEQISYLAGQLSPKSEARAEKLLKGVPHGNISSGNVTKVATDNAAPTPSAGNADGGARRKQGASEGKN